MGGGGQGAGVRERTGLRSARVFVRCGFCREEVASGRLP